MDARKRIAVVATVAALSSVVTYGGLTTTKGTENEPVASKTTVTESVHTPEIDIPLPVVPPVPKEIPQEKTEPVKVSKKAETKEVEKKASVKQPKEKKVVVKSAKDEKSEPVPPTHAAIADMLELYLENHREKAVSRTKLLKYISWADRYTEGTKIDPLWILAMAYQESKFNEKSVSSHEAIGLMQILPSTAKSLGVSPSDLYDPKVSIKTSIKYLSYLLDRYDGNLRTATIAYNQGEGNVDRGKARSWYYNDVKEHYDKMVRMLEEGS